MVGLTPQTLTNYVRPGYSNLQRGTDFIIRCWPAGPWMRRRLYFTDRGVARLQARAYRTFRPDGQSPRARAFIEQAAMVELKPVKATRPLGSFNRVERRMRVRELNFRVAREYLSNPCAVPNCPCITHRLGLPRAEELAALGIFPRQK